MAPLPPHIFPKRLTMIIAFWPILSFTLCHRRLISQPTPSCFWLRHAPGGHIPRSSLRNTFSFTRPRTVRMTLMAQWLKTCIPTSGRPGSVTSVRIPHLGLSFLIGKMDSNTYYLPYRITGNIIWHSAWIAFSQGSGSYCVYNGWRLNQKHSLD